MLENNQVRWRPDEMMRRIQGSNKLGETQLIGIGFGREDGRGDPGANGRVWRAVRSSLHSSLWLSLGRNKRGKERGISNWGRPGGWAWRAWAGGPLCPCQVRL